MNMLSKNVQTINRKRMIGFTLIELLLTIAIVSVVSMLSVPVYQNYQTRTKISGDLAMMHPLMLRMNEMYALTGDWPISNDDAGAHKPSYYKGRYLKSASISESPQAGSMTLTYDSDELPVLRGTDTIVFYPVNGSNSARWQCDQGTIPSKYRPSKCKQ